MKRIFILIFSFTLLFTNCDKNSQQPVGNLPPDTRILSWVISPFAVDDSLGNPSTVYPVTVYWQGSDNDGSVARFEYSINDSAFKSTSATQFQFQLDFPEAATSYDLSVRAIDNDGQSDPSPATTIISKNDGAIETVLRSGPQNGATVNAYTLFRIAAYSSSSGKITHIRWRIENVTDWADVATNSRGEADIYVLNIPAGGQIICFAGVRDDGASDDTPLSISIISHYDEIRPPLIIAGSDIDHGGWFSNLDLTITWNQFDTEQIGWPGLVYSYALNDSLNFDYASGAMASGWQDTNQVTLDHPQLLHGINWFYLKVKDPQNRTNKVKINFVNVTPPFDLGILVVNGVNAGHYGTSIVDRINAAAFWGNVPVYFWDIYGTWANPQPVFDLPDNATYFGGGVNISPDILGRFSTTVWISGLDDYDESAWFASPINPYLEAGGNIILFSRYPEYMLSNALTERINLTWLQPENIPGTFQQEYRPLFPGLVDMGWPYGASTPFSVDDFDSGYPLSDYAVTEWDSLRCFSRDAHTTLLFAHRSNNSEPTFPYSQVAGYGVWLHPSLVFSSLNTGDEYPAPGSSEARGNSIVLSGRPYTFDIDALQHNFEFMLKYLCGER